MVVGGLLFFGHWLYRIYDQADLHHEEQLKVLEALVRAVSTPSHASGIVSAAVEDASAPAGDPASGGPFYATSSGTVYHRADCAVITNHPEDVRVLGPSARAGLRPCQICSPPG
jgi:hypothetical protein